MTRERTLEALRAARGLFTTLDRDLETSHPAVALVRQAIDIAERSLTVPSDQAVDHQSHALLERIHVLESELCVRDEFISAVGHELRNPLSPVFLIVDRLSALLQRAPGGTVSTSELLPHVQNLRRRTQTLVDSLNRLLDMSRLGAGRIELVLEPVDLVEVAREVASGLERELSAASCDLELSADGPVIGRWDRVRVAQILANLLSNAIRYGAGNPIEVRVGGDEARAILRVRDYGIGIDDCDKPRIFERFERGSGAKHRGGFGVGLWIVRQLCEAMGGSIHVQSQRGEGSMFTVTLPRDGSGSAS